MKPVRVVVADNFPIVREGLRSLLMKHEGIAVVAEAADGDEALAQATEHHPDVLIIELKMPGLPWHQILKRTEQMRPSIAVLVVTAHRERHFAIPTLRAGARGFVSKTQPTEDLIDAVRQVAEGKVFIRACSH
jgi:two-component system invasion response regulator UvrY